MTWLGAMCRRIYNSWQFDVTLGLVVLYFVVTDGVDWGLIVACLVVRFGRDVWRYCKRKWDDARGETV